MSLAPGVRFGPYEIISVIGAGGMGEVYRAKDTRLNRIVAIKVLPGHLSSNPQLKQRFEREARTISSLSHPNICSLYDIGEKDGVDYLVMEFIEGETLASRVGKGALPTDLVLKLGIQIAEALDKAHRQGVIHRDLKPGNIMITKSGAKLLDFGLAKFQVDPEDPTASILETREPLTQEGVVLGTVQYMAPEQLEGKATDQRTDIFALGEILYEMVTGQRPFRGGSKASLISSILATEPPSISSIQPLAPPVLDHIIRKCLAKDPEDRWQNARDVASELKWIAQGTSSTTTSPQPVTRKKIRERYIWMSALLILIGAWIASNFFLKRPESKELLRVSILPQERMRITGHIAVSPNGKYVAYTATDSTGVTALFVRSLETLTSNRLPGTDNLGYALPFWSPDSRYVAYFASGKLKKSDINGVPPQTLCDAPSGRGGTWNANGIILFSPNFAQTPIYQIPAEGGTPTKATDLISNEQNHTYPSFLPDGKHFLYTARGKDLEHNGIYLGVLGSNERKLIIQSKDPIKGQYADPGYILYVSEKNLLARPFDVKTLTFKGDAVTITENLGFDGSYYSYSVSPKGILAYTNIDLLNTQLAWIDRTGKVISNVGNPNPCIEPYFSPNEEKALVGCVDVKIGITNMWIVDIARALTSRFTFDDHNNYAGIWSPDGNWIAYSSSKSGTFDLYIKSARGTGIEQPLYQSKQSKFTDDWSRDGRSIIFENEDENTHYDLWVMSYPEKKVRPYLQTPVNEAHARFSPDGKWVAYGSDETGRSEIYMRPFPDSSLGKWQISTAGGDQPTWKGDGKELYYLSPDGRIVAVELQTENGFQAGTPTPLFQTGVTPVGLVGADRNQYLVSADGKKFLVNTLPEGAMYSPIQLIFNWTKMLK